MNKAPIIEIARILAARGHNIEFGTLQGQELWAKKYAFITKTYILGPGVEPDESEREYIKMSDWNVNRGFGPVLDAKKFLDKSWYQKSCIIGLPPLILLQAIRIPRPEVPDGRPIKPTIFYHLRLLG